MAMTCHIEDPVLAKSHFTSLLHGEDGLEELKDHLLLAQDIRVICKSVSLVGDELETQGNTTFGLINYRTARAAVHTLLNSVDRGLDEINWSMSKLQVA